jgi:maltose O-acetyltransferase
MPRSERDKMLAGELYLASDPELVALRRRARRLTRFFNTTTEEETDLRASLIAELFGSVGAGSEIEPPFRCDYGFNIHAGRRLYINFGCVILDVCEVRLGDSCFLGPGVHLYAATHPTDPDLRAAGPELGAPITIGRRVWIGGGAIVCPGVTIGDDAVIGAGSVVTRDLPPRVIAAGNPCRVIRPINANDDPTRRHALELPKP